MTEEEQARFEEFDKYMKDWCKEHNIRWIIYWSHYPGGGYWIHGQQQPVDNRPEIPGYQKIPIFKDFQERGQEFEVLTYE